VKSANHPLCFEPFVGEFTKVASRSITSDLIGCGKCNIDFMKSVVVRAHPLFLRSRPKNPPPLPPPPPKAS